MFYLVLYIGTGYLVANRNARKRKTFGPYGVKETVTRVLGKTPLVFRCETHGAIACLRSLTPYP